MPALWILLLATVAYALIPMSQRQWIQFVKAQEPQYNLTETEEIQPEIILAEYIDVRQPLAKMSQMVRNTMTDFAQKFQEYADDVKERVK